MSMEYIKSPLNYVGGKYKLLPQIMNYIPKDINTCVDLFCGGLDFSINVKANKIISNDIITPIIKMYQYFNVTATDEIINKIEYNIKQYSLSRINKEGYLRLRNNYNTNYSPIDLMTLIAYCYNNQIRFNSKFQFNRAFGKNRSSFNDCMKNNLVQMINKIHNTNIIFTNIDYQNYMFNNLKMNDFVYCDPPYLITNADYSIQARWDENKEEKLLNILDNLNENNIKFALSNVIEHDGKENNILKEWSRKYIVHNLNNTYTNSNASKKIKNGISDEVLITNYSI